MKCNEESIVGSCGIGVIYGLESLFGRDLSHLVPSGGAGWELVAFIENDKCSMAYKTLKKRWPIVYQSPVRRNINSGNNFFFCIYDTSDNEKGYGFDAEEKQSEEEDEEEDNYDF